MPGSSKKNPQPESPASLAAPRRASETASTLHQVVKQQITDAILLGHWPAGTVLPNEITLARQFGVAVGTLRRALADLTGEGLLSRQRKTGTVVTGRTPQHSLRFLFKYFRLHGVDGDLQESQSRNLSLDVGEATESERTALQLAEDAQVVRFRRIRSIDGRPVMHDLFVLVSSRIPGFPRDPVEAPALLYQHLLDRYGIRISAVREQISAELAGEAIGKLLGIDPAAPVLVIEEIAYDQANGPTIMALHHATTENHRYITEIR